MSRIVLKWDFGYIYPHFHLLDMAQAPTSYVPSPAPGGFACAIPEKWTDAPVLVH